MKIDARYEPMSNIFNARCNVDSDCASIPLRIVSVLTLRLNSSCAALCGSIIPPCVWAHGSGKRYRGGGGGGGGHVERPVIAGMEGKSR